MRAVLDTNVVMSAIFFGGIPQKILRAAFALNGFHDLEIMKPSDFLKRIDS